MKLGDVTDVLAGVGFPKEMQGKQDGEIPVFKVGDISAAWLQGKNFLTESRNYLSQEDAKSLGRLVPAGTTVFAKIGEALRLNRRVMLGCAALVDNNVMGLVPDEAKVSPKYLYYFMQTVDLGDLSRSTTVPSIRKSDVLDIPIKVPGLADQNQIVAELETQFSRLDEAVANLQRVKANLKRYKVSVLKAAVEGRLVETEASIAQREGRSYETGEQLLQRILDERRVKWSGKGKYKEPSAVSLDGLAAVPHGWSCAAGGQLFRWSSGVNLPVKNLNGGDVPVYGGNGVNGWHTESNIAHPTLVIGRVGAGCGNVHFVMRSAWITDNAIFATEVPIACDLRYLEIVFFTANLNSVAAGSGQPFVNQTILNDTLVPLPPSTEQSRIVAEVDRHLFIICEVESEVDANLRRAQALRQATLAKAFAL